MSDKTAAAPAGQTLESESSRSAFAALGEHACRAAWEWKQLMFRQCEYRKVREEDTEQSLFALSTSLSNLIYMSHGTVRTTRVNWRTLLAKPVQAASRI